MKITFINCFDFLFCEFHVIEFIVVCNCYASTSN
nr:MAG TPA: hypothetical protein [Caudoviricetes sp.]